MKKTLIYLTLLILGVGCQPVALTQSALQSAPDVGYTAPVLTAQEPKKDDTQMTQSSPSSGLEFLIEKAKEELTQRLSIATSEISLVEAREVTWPDSSLGCPQPGMKYKQVPEDGALIILQVEGKLYEYHTGGSRELFLCEKTYKDPSPPPKIDIFNLTPSKPDTESSTDPPLPDNDIPPGEDQ